MGNDFPNRAAANWGPLQAPNSMQASQNALNSVDSKQRPLVKAIAQLVNAAAADLYGSNEDRKYRYIVDLILDRVRGALEKQLSGFSNDQLEAISKQNEALLKSVSEATSGIVESAFSKLQVTVDKKQAEELLDTLQDKLDAAASDIKTKLQSAARSSSSSKKSGDNEDVATKSDQLETTKTLEELKRQLAKQFSADKSSNGGSSTTVKKSGKSAFKAASALVISKQLSNLAKNQKIINQNMTKRFEKTTKTISGSVDSLHATTSTSFYNLNDKLEDSMAKLGRQTKRMTGAIVAGVVGAVSLVTAGLKKTFGAIFGGLKSISGKLFGLFKKPASIIGGLLKNLVMTPGGMFAIGWIAGYVWKRWLKPLWDWMKPIREAIGEWFGGKITFKDMVGKIWDHISVKMMQIVSDVRQWFSEHWDQIKDIGGKVWKWIKTNASEAWNFIQPHLQTFWEKILSPALSIAWDWTKDKVGKFWDWLLKQEIGGFTVKTWMIGLGAVVGAYAVYKVFKIIRGIYRFGKAIFSALKWVKSGFMKLLGFFKIKVPKGPPVKGKGGRTKGRGGKSKKPQTKKAPAKKPPAKKATTGKTRSQRAKTQPRDAKGKFTKKPTAAKPGPKVPTKAPTPKVPAPKSAGALKKGGQMVGKGLKVGAKALGAGLVVADAAGNVIDAYGAFKKGEIAEGLSQTGFAGAKAATLAAGPLAPVAYGAIMAAEAANEAIKESAAQLDSITDDLNKKMEEDFKGKVLAAMKKQGEKNPLDKLLDKYKNFDEIKAKADPLTAKINELEKQHEKMSSSWWHASFNGDKIRKLANQIEDLRNQRGEMLAKAGLNLRELDRGKAKLLDSREASGILKQMSPEMQARFKQLMAENTKIGPDNMKFLPDTQKILEQMQVEFGGQTEVVGEKVDSVNEKADKILAGLEAISHQQGELAQRRDLPPIVVNSQTINAAPSQSQVMRDK